MRNSSINFQRVNATEAFFHNARSNGFYPNHAIQKYAKENFYSVSGYKAFIDYQKLYFKTNAVYRTRTGQNMQPSTKNVLYEAVVNLNKNHNEADVLKVVKYIEKITGMRCIQYSIHRDEGILDENAELGDDRNFHAHLTFFHYDMNGLSLMRKLYKNKAIFSQMQTDVANILGMPRGSQNSKAKHLPPQIYKEFMRRTDDLRKQIQSLLSISLNLKKENEDLKEKEVLLIEEIANLQTHNKDMREFIKSKHIKESELDEFINRRDVIKPKGVFEMIFNKDEADNNDMGNIDIKDR